MKASMATKPARTGARRARHNSDSIARRALAIRCHWSARERSKRATVARQLQSLLLASIARAVHESIANA